MITGVIHLVTDKKEGVSSEGFEGARMGEGGILVVVREGARMGEGGIMAVVRGRGQGIYVNLRKPGCSIINVMCLLQ